MNSTIYLPNKDTKGLIEKIELNNNVALATTTGLKKNKNEDSIGYIKNGTSIRICIADGHWGIEASRMIVRFWINKNLNFPINHLSAERATKKIEHILYKEFGKPFMDENKDLTPEASFICVEISKENASIISYGDVRLIITNNGILKYQQPCNDTWLGAFSYKGLRNRLSVKQATLFKKIALEQNDKVLIFSDGIDQCVYEKNTIDIKKIAKLSKEVSPIDVIDPLLKEVFAYGSEDNASIALISHYKK